jgi:hypothetical protein
MAQAQFKGQRPLAREQAKLVWVHRDLHRTLAVMAASEGRNIQDLASDAITLYLMVKSGDARVEYVGEGT